jgi:hypothetical protein
MYVCICPVGSSGPRNTLTKKTTRPQPKKKKEKKRNNKGKGRKQRKTTYIDTVVGCVYDNNNRGHVCV